jgi:hypothetical protein
MLMHKINLLLILFWVNPFEEILQVEAWTKTEGKRKISKILLKV